MATRKTTTEKKAVTKKATAKTFSISYQRPGVAPENLKMKAGTTVSDLIQEMNIEGYIISINGVQADKTQLLAKDDIVRVGIKTKNAIIFGHRKIIC
jgi:sulfur carrier protein ThiS